MFSVVTHPSARPGGSSPKGLCSRSVHQPSGGHGGCVPIKLLAFYGHLSSGLPGWMSSRKLRNLAGLAICFIVFQHFQLVYVSMFCVSQFSFLGLVQVQSVISLFMYCFYVILRFTLSSVQVKFIKMEAVVFSGGFCKIKDICGLFIALVIYFFTDFLDVV